MTTADRVKTHRLVTRTFIALLSVLVLTVGSVLIFQLRNGVLYWLALRYPIGFWQQDKLPIEDVWFSSEDGNQLHGWFLDKSPSRGVLLFVHGSGGNITWRAEVLRRLNQDLGLTVFIFDYRGYGKSRGDPNEAGLYQDTAAAFTFLLAKNKVQEKDVLVLGESLGGAVAIDLVVHRKVKGLILVDTFPAIAELMQFYPRVPAFAWASQVYDGREKIKRYHGPLLMKHGDADSVVPIVLALDRATRDSRI